MIRGYSNRLYRIWSNMKQRTRNPLNPSFADYGGRGIGVCDLWADSFGDFALDVGTLRSFSPELSLDRIDNDRGYEPGNVRWATSSQQAFNRRRRNDRGENNPRAKLSWAKVATIRRERLAGATQESLAEQYGVTRRLIRRVCDGKVWIAE